MYIDVHAHLEYEDRIDIEDAIASAKEVGVVSIINNGTNVFGNRKSLELASKYGVVKCALGLYPIDALKMTDSEIDAELEFIRSNVKKIVAIGEVGLDYYWDKEQHERQKEIFVKMIKLAEELKKPLIVHSRKAERDVISMLENVKVPVIIHCFGGRLNLLSDKFYYSVPPSIVKSTHFQELVKKVDINQLLTETDAPFQGPTSEDNVPANVVLTVDKIAELKGMEVEEVMKNIFMNYQKVFG